MSSYSKYNYNCNSDARYCVSGCCTYSGSCALTSSSCFYTYSDFYSNRSYYYPGYTDPKTKNTYSNSLDAQYYVEMLAKPVGISLGYLLIVVIGVIICYCRRKASVEAINRMATHNWWDNSPIIRGNGNDATQPAYGVNPTYPQNNNAYQTSPNIPSTARYSSPRKNHILQVKDTDMNISMEGLVLKSKQILPPIQHSPRASKIVNKNDYIQPVRQFEQNLPEISLKTTQRQRPVQQLNQQPSRQHAGQILKGNIQYEQKNIINPPDLKPGQRLVQHTIQYLIEQQHVEENVKLQKVETLRKMEQQQEFVQQPVQSKIQKIVNKQIFYQQKVSMNNPVQETAQKLMQKPLQQNIQQFNQQQAHSLSNQNFQKQAYPMPPSKFDNISNSLNTLFNRLFQNNAPPVKLVSYQPPIQTQ